MAKIKQSKLKELFKENNLSDGIFDIFNTRLNKLKKKLKNIDADIETLISSAPTKKEKERLRDLSDFLRKAHSKGSI